MPSGEKDGGWKETLLGFAILAILSVGAIYFLRAAYTKFFLPAPGVVSLAAYFVDDSGAPLPIDALNNAKSHIKIKGDVSQN